MPVCIRAQWKGGWGYPTKQAYDIVRQAQGGPIWVAADFHAEPTCVGPNSSSSPQPHSTFNLVSTLHLSCPHHSPTQCPNNQQCRILTGPRTCSSRAQSSSGPQPCSSVCAASPSLVSANAQTRTTGSQSSHGCVPKREVGGLHGMVASVCQCRAATTVVTTTSAPSSPPFIAFTGGPRAAMAVGPSTTAGVTRRRHSELTISCSSLPSPCPFPSSLLQQSV